MLKIIENWKNIVICVFIETIRIFIKIICMFIKIIRVFIEIIRVFIRNQKNANSSKK